MTDEHVPDAPSAGEGGEPTLPDDGPPFFGSWGKVYALVLITEVVVVTLLAILSAVAQ